MLISLNKEVSFDDFIDIIAEKLNNGGTVTFTPRGKSMLPMLRDGEDVVVLSKPTARLKLFDIPLYKRKDGTYVLHRIVDFDRNGNYVLCGDNQFVLEKGITDNDIIGVVTAFYRKGKAYTVNSLRYRMYVNAWHNIRYIRRIYRFGTRKVSGFINKKGTSSDEKNTQ